MGEISSASNQQASGVAQVGEAVTHMDQATQQNAALVEEMAAAASSLKSQAQELVQTVAAFKIAQTDLAPLTHQTSVRAPAPSQAFIGAERRNDPPPSARKPTPARPVAKVASPRPAPAANARSKATPTGSDDDWETF
jgi:hypothetical protein